MWCLLLTVTAGSWGLGFCVDILKVTQGSQESTSITGVLDRAVVSRWEVWIRWVELYLSHLWRKISLLQWPSSSPQYYWCLVSATISSTFFFKSLLKITEICVTYLISELNVVYNWLEFPLMPSQIWIWSVCFHTFFLLMYWLQSLQNFAEHKQLPEYRFFCLLTVNWGLHWQSWWDFKFALLDLNTPKLIEAGVIDRSLGNHPGFEI